MATSNRVINDQIRAQYLAALNEFMTAQGEEVMQTSANELAFPIVDSEGNEKWVVLVVKIPNGTRDGDAYDGYSMAQDYQMKCETKAAKAKEKAKVKK